MIPVRDRTNTRSESSLVRVSKFSSVTFVPRERKDRHRELLSDTYSYTERLNKMDRFVIKRVSVQSSSTCAPDKNTQANEPGSIIREAASTSASEPPPKKKVKSWTRQYSDEFLKYGFVKCEQEKGEPRPQCVICSEVLANESLKPSKLKRHLETKHPSLATKPVDYFQRRKEQMKMSVKVLNTATTLNDKAQLASYLVSYRIAKEKVPYTCGEKLILPSCVDIVSTMLDGKSADKIKCVPISDTTVSRRISDIAENLELQLVSHLQTAGEFAIQLDESTDISNCAVLLVYVRYVHEDDFLEDMLCCLTLPTHSSGSEIYRVLNDCIVGKYKLNWANCKGITTDGAANMTGKKSGVVTKISEAAGNDVTWRHCFIHREALAAKGIPDNLRGVLNDVVKVINTIKGSALNSRLFELLCLEMGADHSHLLYHTEVRWLSRGRILTRVYELRMEIHIFLLEKKSSMASLFCNDEWILKLSYLSDIFSKLNELNLKLQGKETDVFRHCEEVEAFKKSIMLWQARLAVDQPLYYMFPTLLQHIEEHNNTSEETMKKLKCDIQLHLHSLSSSFEQYFPEENLKNIRDNHWVKDPFAFEKPEAVIGLNLTPDEENELLHLTSDTSLRIRMRSSPLSSFWISVSKEYPHLSKKSILLLIPFTTTYLCEAGFSTLTKLKSKERNRLNPTADMRVALSSCKPDWNKITKDKQAHQSH